MDDITFAERWGIEVEMKSCEINVEMHVYEIDALTNRYRGLQGNKKNSFL